MSRSGAFLLEPSNLMADNRSNLICAVDSAGREASSGRERQTNNRPKFYRLIEKAVRKSSGFELLNGRALFPAHPMTLPIPRTLLPPLGQRGFQQYPEMPVFLVDAKIIKDFAEYSGYWLISDRTKKVLERVDPSAFAFLKCRVQLRDGTDGPRRWLCDVIRTLDALDEEHSKVTIGTSDLGTKTYYIPMSENVFFREERVSPHHIFRLMHTGSYIVCDEEMKRACKAANLTGIEFDDLTGRRRK